MMQTVLVTGANGLVGFHLVQSLLVKDYRVIATSKSESRLPFQHPELHFRQLDITQKENVRQLVSEYQPDYIIHSAAISGPDYCEQHQEAAFLNNVTGTLYLLEEAEKQKSHFIFLSTDFVFDGKKGLCRENEQRNPVNYYGITKMLAEDEVMTFPFNWSIVRTVLVYGKTIPGRENFITQTVKKLRNSEQVNVFADQVRTLTYVEDLAAGILSIIEKKAAGVFHLAGPDATTLYDAAIEIAHLLDLDKSLLHPITENDLQLPARRPLRTGLDISKAQKELNYQPIPLKEGIKRIYA